MKRFLFFALLVVFFFISASKVFAQVTYTWSAPSGVANDWTLSSNWTPTRTTPATDDIIVFDGSVCANPIANLLPTQTVGKIRIYNNARVELNVSASRTITIGNTGITAPHFAVETGSKLTLPSTSALTLTIITGCTGLVSDSVVFSGAAHKLVAADAGSLLFASGSAFRAGIGFTSNPFGTASTKAVIFQRGSVYICQAGANPFGATAPNSAVVFEKGSLYSHRVNALPAVSGRTYANFEVDMPGSSWVATGASPFRCDTLTIKNASGINFEMAGSVIISGDLRLINGTLGFTTSSPQVQTILFDGDVKQTITGGTNIFFNIASELAVAPGAFVDLQGDMGFSDTISVYGKLYTNSFIVISSKFLMHPYVAMGPSPTGNVTLNSNKITNCAEAPNFLRGMAISGTGIPANTYVLRSYGTTIEISRFATATTAGTALSTNTSARGTLGIGSPDGITASPTELGNIQSGTRSFLADGNYEYNGIIPQVTGDGLPATISGKLTINSNASFGTNGVTLTRATTVNGELELITGKLTTVNLKEIILGSSGIVTAAYTDISWVNGPMYKYGNTDFIFPVGKGVAIHPIGRLTVSGGAVGDLTKAEYFNSAPACSPSTLGAPIHHVSGLEYWALSRASMASPSTKVTLYATTYSHATNRSRLVVAYCIPGLGWGSLGNGNTALIGAVGPITSTLAVFNGFTTTSFTLASLDPSPVNPLPIHLISFDATKLTGTKSSVNWELAASCSAAAKFEIQRANADKKFTTIGAIGGSETNKLYNYIDNGLKNGINYYRLKMIDEDGKITYSRTVAIMNGVDGLLLTSLIPTIVTNNTSLTVASSNRQKLDLIIVDMQGRVVLKRNYSVAAGNTNIELQLAGLSAGVYQLTGISLEGKTNTIRFVKQ